MTGQRNVAIKDLKGVDASQLHDWIAETLMKEDTSKLLSKEEATNAASVIMDHMLVQCRRGRQKEVSIEEFREACCWPTEIFNVHHLTKLFDIDRKRQCIEEVFTPMQAILLRQQMRKS